MLIYRVESKKDLSGPFSGSLKLNRKLIRLHGHFTHPGPFTDGLEDAVSRYYCFGVSSMDMLKTWFVDSIYLYNERMMSFEQNDIIWPTDSERDKIISENNVDIQKALEDEHYEVVVFESDAYLHGRSGKQVAFNRDIAKVVERYPISILYTGV